MLLLLNLLVDFECDGTLVFWIPGMKPKEKEIQPNVPGEEIRGSIHEKIVKVSNHKYICKGKVISLIQYSAVP